MKLCNSFMYSEQGADAAPLSGGWGLEKSSSCIVSRMASIASVNEVSRGWIELRIRVAMCLRESVTAVTQSSGRPGRETTARLRLRSNWCSKFTAPAFVFWAAVGGPITCDASPSERIRFSALTAIIWMVFVTFFVTKWPSLVSTNETVSSLVNNKFCYLKNRQLENCCTNLWIILIRLSHSSDEGKLSFPPDENIRLTGSKSRDSDRER